MPITIISLSNFFICASIHSQSWEWLRVVEKQVGWSAASQLFRFAQYATALSRSNQGCASSADHCVIHIDIIMIVGGCCVYVRVRAATLPPALQLAIFIVSIPQFYGIIASVWWMVPCPVFHSFVARKPLIWLCIAPYSSQFRPMCPILHQPILAQSATICEATVYLRSWFKAATTLHKAI